ncbi:MAG TPA: polysaccharide biosynthesis tyrosine autokinase [Candidatus Polarisedimenticolaceae bacterium]|nr:polysaccharide biosynthesis tyrosine autokinase [Candidatus Polarisedimenticolaceae bacterium]
MWDLWRIVVRRRTLVFAAVALSVALTAVVTLLSTPIYQATTTIQIERRGSGVLNYKDVTSVDPSFAGYQDFYQTQYRILQSDAVLRLAARRLDLPNRPDYAGRESPPIARLVGWVLSALPAPSRSDRARDGETDDPHDQATSFLRARLSVQPVRGSQLVRVSFLDRDPALARDSANAVAAAYQEFSLQSRYSTTAQASEFLTKQVAELQQEAAAMERRLQALSAEKEILALRDDTKDISTLALTDLNAKLVESKARLALAGARYDAVRTAPADSMAEVLRSPLINNLRQQYAELERKHRQMSERFRDDWPALRQVTEELTQAAARLELETETIATRVRGVARAERDQAGAEVRLLQARVDEQKQVVQRVSLDAVEIASLQAEIKTKRRFLDELVNRQNQTEVTDRLRDPQASNIRVVDAARAPDYPVRPRKLLNLLASLVAGLVLGAGAALLSDHLDNTVKNEADVRIAAGLPVLGQIRVFESTLTPSPVGPSPTHWPDQPGLGCHVEPLSVFAEAFKSLRTSLLLAAPDHPPRSILITSAEPGDGKSTVAVNLSTVLTQLGKRVLLVGADLRRPSVHSMLDLPNKRGLSNLLTGTADLRDVVCESAVPRLDVIPSGPIPPTPSELLGSAGMGALIDRLLNDEGYDHVVIDSPPAAQVTDAVILSAYAAATVVTARAGATTRDALALTLERLRRARAHLPGIVLNGARVGGDYRYRLYYGESAGPEHGRGPERLVPRRRASRKRATGV